ncbi:MAG: potassium channel family protein [Nanoarchaeota archaeon]
MLAVKGFLYGLGVLTIIFIVGTITFSTIENVPIFDAFYYVLLTITTVGSIYQPKTTSGKLLTALILFFGIGTVLYIATFLTRTLVEGETKKLIVDIRRRVIKMKKLKEHIIVCGYGRTGKHVCDILKEKGLKYVIIDKKVDRYEKLMERNENAIHGNAEEPEILEQAGIKNAKSLIATLGDDADNIYLVMTAKEINPNLLLAARAQEEEAVARLKRIGADIVVQPQIEGGKQLVNAILGKN